uniref:Uncharacterized protein n=1 Tax=Romanomermis culicivorax TaxID=13658 RepID=A0A915I5P8_ROMCU
MDFCKKVQFRSEKTLGFLSPTIGDSTSELGFIPLISSAYQVYIRNTYDVRRLLEGAVYLGAPFIRINTRETSEKLEDLGRTG